MKKEIINTIRFAAAFTIVYFLIDLVNWKEVWPTIDFIYIIRIIITFILVGSLTYFLNKKLYKSLSKKKLDQGKPQ